MIHPVVLQEEVDQAVIYLGRLPMGLRSIYLQVEALTLQQEVTIGARDTMKVKKQTQQRPELAVVVAVRTRTGDKSRPMEALVVCM